MSSEFISHVLTLTNIGLCDKFYKNHVYINIKRRRFEVIAQKSKVRTAVAVGVPVAAITAIVIIVLVFARSMMLKNAVKNLDISDESTVIKVMKYGGRDIDIVTHVASAYIDGADYSSAVKLLLYSVQYLSPESDTQLIMLRDCYAHLGADEIFLSQFDSPTFELEDFETSSVYESQSCGFSNGVYITFCGGYAKAKISSVIPLSAAACRSGVYVLDSSDRILKFLSDTGLELRIVNDTRMNEFLYLNDRIYYIDENNIPYGTVKYELKSGEFAAELREENGLAVCTVYDKNYNKLRDINLE